MSCVYVQVQGAHLRALSHYYAAMVHMTIVKNLKKSDGESYDYYLVNS